MGKAHAEAARGNGAWPLQPHPCHLEPPWQEFDRNAVCVFDCWLNNWNAGWEGGLLKRLLGFEKAVWSPGQPIILPKDSAPAPDELVPILVEQFHEDESTLAKAEEFLRTLLNVRHPVAFELIGLGEQPEYAAERDGNRRAVVRPGAAQVRPVAARAVANWRKPYIRTQFVAHRSDAPQIERQLLAHFPNSAIMRGKSAEPDSLAVTAIRAGAGHGGTLALRHYYCWPLRNFSRLDADPLGVAIAAMEHLARREWAVLQILLQPASSPWEQTLRQAVSDSYQPGKYLLPQMNERLVQEKFSSPLFATSIRIASSRLDVFRQMEGWAEQFAAPPQALWTTDRVLPSADPKAPERSALADSLERRCSFRPGMLLSLPELVALVHLPALSFPSARLKQVQTRTRPVVQIRQQPGSILLGDNVHRGQTFPARIPAELRARHCYVAGASGTGKSTLLLNMMLQDISAGHGCALLDPHGDLVTAVLRRIPQHRTRDVILFDPADDEFPFALNILEARDESERERIVAETVMALERYFPASWGPRLERILTYTLYTVLEAIPGATLADVERMLTDERFRETTVGRASAPRFVEFWKRQFKFFPKNAVDPVLNKLSVFLTSRTVRNIICQRRSAIDFDRLLSDGKIFLANLSAGLLTEKVAGTFGSFLVTKIVNAAFRRARLPEPQRRPFYLYVDEFQAFMNVSVGFERILAEARKQALFFTGGNQYIGQLSPTVRQAVFGNVGSLIVFRVGVEDAAAISRELGVFTADEILSLGVGQAIVRPGESSSTFNLQTYPAPPSPAVDPSKAIRTQVRSEFAQTRAHVESLLQGTTERVESRAGAMGFDGAPTDPDEDDLVE